MNEVERPAPRRASVRIPALVGVAAVALLVTSAPVGASGVTLPEATQEAGSPNFQFASPVTNNLARTASGADDAKAAAAAACRQSEARILATQRRWESVAPRRYGGSGASRAQGIDRTHGGYEPFGGHGVPPMDADYWPTYRAYVQNCP